MNMLKAKEIVKGVRSVERKLGDNKTRKYPQEKKIKESRAVEMKRS